MLKELLSRNFHYTIPQFSILQWNQLNSKLCDAKSFPKINPDYLSFDFRKNLIKKELLSYLPDIICLEEVDQTSFYEEFLQSQGYSILKGQKFGGVGDWIILAYLNKKFKLLDYSIQHYNEKQEKHSQLFLRATLQMDSDRVLWILATHLKAKDFEETRKMQTKELLEHLNKYKLLKPEERKKIGIVLCGDFNAEPHYECMKDLLGFLESSYKDAEFTTYKIRDKLYCRVIDYMLYGKESLRLVGRQEIPKREDILAEGLPNVNYPSDHLSLYGVFQFKE